MSMSIVNYGSQDELDDAFEQLMEDEQKHVWLVNQINEKELAIARLQNEFKETEEHSSEAESLTYDINEAKTELEDLEDQLEDLEG